MKTIIGIIYIILGLILIGDSVIRFKNNDIAMGSLDLILGGYLLLTQYIVYRRSGKLGPICCCGTNETDRCSINHSRKTS
ncbi:MAG: hypothetical protein ACPL0D_05695 [Thermosulfidibacteraceae bacterium]|jgi:hypothetical protein